MDEVRMLLQEILDEGLYQITVSKALHPGEDGIFKKKVRPVMMKGTLLFQITSYAGKQVFHENLSAGKAGDQLPEDMRERFAQLQADTVTFSATVLVSTAIVMIFCNQAVMVMLDAQLLGKSYAARDASRTELAIDIENSGVVIAGLVPWSIAITMPLAMLGVGLEALPWCVLLYMIPLCYLFTKRFFRAGQNRPLQPERT